MNGFLAALQEACAGKVGKTLDDLIAGCLEPIAEAEAVGVIDLGSLKPRLTDWGPRAEEDGGD